MPNITAMPDEYLYVLMNKLGLDVGLDPAIKEKFSNMDEKQLNQYSAEMMSPDFWKQYDMEATGNYFINSQSTPTNNTLSSDKLNSLYGAYQAAGGKGSMWGKSGYDAQGRFVGQNDAYNSDANQGYTEVEQRDPFTGEIKKVKVPNGGKPTGYGLVNDLASNNPWMVGSEYGRSYDPYSKMMNIDPNSDFAQSIYDRSKKDNSLRQAEYKKWFEEQLSGIQSKLPELEAKTKEFLKYNDKGEYKTQEQAMEEAAARYKEAFGKDLAGPAPALTPFQEWYYKNSGVANPYDTPEQRAADAYRQTALSSYNMDKSNWERDREYANKEFKSAQDSLTNYQNSLRTLTDPGFLDKVNQWDTQMGDYYESVGINRDGIGANPNFAPTIESISFDSWLNSDAGKAAGYTGGYTSDNYLWRQQNPNDPAVKASNANKANQMAATGATTTVYGAKPGWRVDSEGNNVFVGQGTPQMRAWDSATFGGNMTSAQVGISDPWKNMYGPTNGSGNKNSGGLFI